MGTQSLSDAPLNAPCKHRDVEVDQQGDGAVRNLQVGEALGSVYAIAWEIGFVEGYVLAPIVLSQADFESGPLSASTLVQTIRREGVAA